MLLCLPKHDLHRERCSRCGKTFLTVVDDSYWRLPIAKRPGHLCPACKLQEAKNWGAGIFGGKKDK